MAPDPAERFLLSPPKSVTEGTLEPIYRLYQALVTTVPFDADHGLGGKLLCAGDTECVRSLLYAANIAGVASLAAFPDAAAQRQAIRDGVVDFAVTSLGEALRILKNEIRKQQGVSVGVGVAPRQLVDEMLDRGVLPDLLGAVSDEKLLEPFLAQGALCIASPADSGAHGETAFVSWSVDRRFARYLEELDERAEKTIPAEDTVRQRWLRFSPRYLGRMARERRGISMNPSERDRFESELHKWRANHLAETGEDVAVVVSDSL
jgi:Urocanase Rossmann-like domain